MVPGLLLPFLRQILEKEFQKCEAQPAFLPGFIWAPPGDFVVGLHGSGVPSCVFSLNIEREFQKCEAQPAFLPPCVHLGAPPGDFVVGLRVFSSNPREGVSKVWSLTAFLARMFILSILAAWAHILPE